MLCKLRHYVNEASTKSIYYAIFYYDLSHVCPAYGQNLNPNHRIKLLQKKAMRKVSFAHHDPHTLPIFSLRRFETLLAACCRFAMVRISDNGPGWK